MPGLCGYLQTSPESAPSCLLDGMLVKLDIASSPFVGRREDAAGRFGLGVSTLGILTRSAQPAAMRDGELLAILDGELYGMESLREKLRIRGREIAANDYAAALLATYADGGAEATASLDGSFAATVLDTRDLTLTLISDTFGTRPLYYAQHKTRFTFASRIAALLSDDDVLRDLDWQGISQFFTFGHYFNDNTSLSHVKILPAGAALHV